MHKPPFHCPSQVPADLLGIKRKKMYSSRREAQAADKTGRPYWCKHCRMWHLTHTQKRKKS